MSRHAAVIDRPVFKDDGKDRDCSPREIGWGPNGNICYRGEETGGKLHIMPASKLKAYSPEERKRILASNIAPDVPRIPKKVSKKP